MRRFQRGPGCPAVLLHRFIQPQSFLLSCWRTWSFFAHSAESQTFPYFGDRKNTELKSKQRFPHFNKWQQKFPTCSSFSSHSKSGFKQLKTIFNLAFASGGGWVQLGVLPCIWIRAEVAHRKASLSTYLVPGLGRLLQLRLECGVLSVHISFSVWLCLHGGCRVMGVLTW